MNALAPSNVLLTDGNFYGTIAAARYFGRLGHRVVIADADRTNAARYSKYVSQSVEFPDRGEFEARIEMLAAYGKANPGTLIYPCSDDLAWLLALNAPRIAPCFTTLQPDFSVIENLLDKQKLYTTAQSLGVAVPETWYPANDADLLAMAKNISGQILIKPKTQVGLRIGKKGALVEGGATMVSAYRQFRSRYNYLGFIREHSEALNWPMLQRFDPSASSQTISVAGYRSRDGKFYSALASRKVLQYPLNIGVGLCFEGLDERRELSDQVQKICEAVGYFGVFEVEFIRGPDGGHTLMDFNPRFYGQMQFEIDRGLALPGLVLSDARGQELTAPAFRQDRRYLLNRSLLKLISTTQRLGGRISENQRRDWLSLGRREGDCWSDQIFDQEDRRPWLADMIKRLLKYMRNPRSSWRTLFGSS